MCVRVAHLHPVEGLSRRSGGALLRPSLGRRRQLRLDGHPLRTAGSLLSRVAPALAGVLMPLPRQCMLNARARGTRAEGLIRGGLLSWLPDKWLYVANLYLQVRHRHLDRI